MPLKISDRIFHYLFDSFAFTERERNKRSSHFHSFFLLQSILSVV